MPTYNKNCGSVPVAISLSNEVRSILHDPVAQPASQRQLLLLVGGVEDKGARQGLQDVDHLVRWNALSLRQRQSFLIANPIGTGRKWRAE